MTFNVKIKAFILLGIIIFHVFFEAILKDSPSYIMTFSIIGVVIVIIGTNASVKWRRVSIWRYWVDVFQKPWLFAVVLIGFISTLVAVTILGSMSENLNADWACLFFYTGLYHIVFSKRYKLPPEEKDSNKTYDKYDELARRWQNRERKKDGTWIE